MVREGKMELERQEEMGQRQHSVEISDPQRKQGNPNPPPSNGGCGNAECQKQRNLVEMKQKHIQQQIY